MKSMEHDPEAFPPASPDPSPHQSHSSQPYRSALTEGLRRLGAAAPSSANNALEQATAMVGPENGDIWTALMKGQGVDERARRGFEHWIERHQKRLNEKLNAINDADAATGKAARQHCRSELHAIEVRFEEPLKKLYAAQRARCENQAPSLKREALARLGTAWRRHEIAIALFRMQIRENLTWMDMIEVREQLKHDKEKVGDLLKQPYDKEREKKKRRNLAERLGVIETFYRAPMEKEYERILSAFDRHLDKLSPAEKSNIEARREEARQQRAEMTATIKEVAEGTRALGSQLQARKNAQPAPAT